MPITNRLTLTRRRLLATTALVPLAACVQSGAVPVSVNLPSWASAIQAIGQYFTQNFLPTIKGAGANVPAGTLGTIESIVGSIGQAAGAVSMATTQTQGQGILQTIEGYINNLAPVAAPLLALIPGVGPVLSIGIAALPAIEGLVNVGSTLLSPLAQQIAASPVATTPTAAARALTPAEALGKVLAATGH